MGYLLSYCYPYLIKSSNPKNVDQTYACQTQIKKNPMHQPSFLNKSISHYIPYKNLYKTIPDKKLRQYPKPTTRHSATISPLFSSFSSSSLSRNERHVSGRDTLSLSLSLSLAFNRGGKLMRAGKLMVVRSYSR